MSDLSSGQLFALALSGLGNIHNPNATSNGLNLLNSMYAQNDRAVQKRKDFAQADAARNLLSPSASAQFNIPQPAQFTAGADADNPDASNGTVTPGGPPITGNLLNNQNRDSLMATALGPLNALKMQIDRNTPDIKMGKPGEQPYDARTGKPIGSPIPGQDPATQDAFLKNLRAYEGMADTDPNKPFLKAWLDKNSERAPQADKVSYNQMTPAQIAQWGMAPGTVAVMGSNGKPEVVAKDNTALDLPKRQPGQSDDEYLADLAAVDPGAAATAHAIANYQQPLPSTRAGTPNPVALAALALNPNLDNKQYKARNAIVNDFTTGKTADIKTYLGRTISNLGTYYDSVKALNNHGGLATILNAPGNMYGDMTGDDLVSSAKEASDTFATEARNVFAKGPGGNLEEFRTWRGHVSPNVSPQQLEGNKNTFLKNFDGQLSATANRWNSVMPEKKSKADLLDPESLDVLKRIAPDYYQKIGGPAAAERMGGAAGGQQAPSGPQPQAAAAGPQAPQMPPGMVRQGGTYQGKPVYYDAQGRRYVDTGG